jgi:hypothetical protein
MCCVTLATQILNSLADIEGEFNAVRPHSSALEGIMQVS